MTHKSISCPLWWAAVYFFPVNEDVCLCFWAKAPPR